MWWHSHHYPVAVCTWMGGEFCSLLVAITSVCLALLALPATGGFVWLLEQFLKEAVGRRAAVDPTESALCEDAATTLRAALAASLASPALPAPVAPLAAPAPLHVITLPAVLPPRRTRRATSRTSRAKSTRTQ